MKVSFNKMLLFVSEQGNHLFVCWFRKLIVAFSNLTTFSALSQDFSYLDFPSCLALPSKPVNGISPKGSIYSDNELNCSIFLVICPLNFDTNLAISQMLIERVVYIYL